MEKKEKCTAKSKQSGQRCGNYPLKGRTVCKFHGGKSTGPKTVMGRRKCKEVNVTHSLFTAEAIAERRAFNEILKEHRKAINAL